MTDELNDMKASIAERVAKRKAGEKAEADARKSRRRDVARDEDVKASALAAVAQGHRPDVKNIKDWGERDVPNPYNAEHKARCVTSLRDDPLGRLAKRRQIDEAQLAAGRRYQEDFETAEISGARAIDPTKEAVDGGGFTDPFNDRMVIAAKRLARYSRVLGMEGEALVRDVLCKRMMLAECAAARGMDSRADNPDMKYLGRRMRECLETLAWHLGLSGRGPPRTEPDDELADVSSYAGNARLFEAVRRALNEA